VNLCPGFSWIYQLIFQVHFRGHFWVISWVYCQSEDVMFTEFDAVVPPCSLLDIRGRGGRRPVV
jgi:hypothetical protein